MTSPGRTAIGEWLRGFLDPGASPWPDRPLPSGPFETLLLGADTGERNSVLVFSRGRGAPCLLVKIARDPAGRESLRNERLVLARLSDLGRSRPPAQRIYPRVAGFREFDAFSALVQEAIDGDTLFHRLRAAPGPPLARVAEIAEAVLQAVADLGDLDLGPAGGAADSPPEAARSEWKRCASELAGRLADSAEARRQDGRLERLNDKIDRVNRAAFQHGDLFPKNILLPDAPGNPPFVAIDWADAGRRLPPLFDVVLFLSTLWHSGAGSPSEDERLARFRALFEDNDPLAAVADRAFHRGRERWGLGDDWSRGEIAFLALAVYGRRLAARYGEENTEMRILRKNAGHALRRIAQGR